VLLYICSKPSCTCLRTAPLLRSGRPKTMQGIQPVHESEAFKSIPCVKEQSSNQRGAWGKGLQHLLALLGSWGRCPCRLPALGPPFCHHSPRTLPQQALVAA
jgi:hypothetical protein